ncbi:uncharacterized protein LOC112346797 [Selaginella moellendorffii]|uniref:uncharacterized protein LOC112346797 n=1 Tax=Selaginella moellendorffii TaxID=88036 RepID=UPI000D1CA48E|nr:uncharacterized protein LOC112346797 [Selaginella moellendorffii]|eukprot:XP_024532238.1 uncharacterized protein LOC112346797 [Selaginella moellendorffii]
MARIRQRLCCLDSQAPSLPTPSPASKHLIRMNKKSIADDCDLSSRAISLINLELLLRRQLLHSADRSVLSKQRQLFFFSISEARGGMDGGGGLSWMLHRTKISPWCGGHGRSFYC